ncbi:MAG TPA: ferritin-like domain-containing protein [Longimicrobiales bacterium]|nr:ferritin-like domain-containing protein [Longimicrobiales bacterium]
MQINAIELGRLNFYRASELHGGLVLGQLVKRVRDGDLMLSLTRHSAEEVMHAQLWTEAILAVGGRPAPVRDTYQRRLAHRLGAPSSVFQVLALTQVFERRVYRHFIYHARLHETHPVVRACLERMIEEEKGHLSWVQEWLAEEGQRRGVDVRTVMNTYAAADTAVYHELMLEHRFLRAA